MKNKQSRKYIIGAALLIVAALLVFWNFPRKPQGYDEKQHSITVDQNQVREVQESNIVKSLPRESSRPRPEKKDIRFIANPLEKHPAEPEGVVYPAFKTGGGVGGRFTIRDQVGTLIHRGTKESPVYSISISPNEQLMWVNGGDVKSYIMNTKGEEVVNFPIVPPGQDVLMFGNWVWLDNNRLLGESGVQNFDENGKPIGCCQGHNMSESRFYVYDLRTNKMEEMQLPENLQGKVVTVGKVLKTGELQLGHEGDGFGWYQVADLDEEDR